MRNLLAVVVTLILCVFIGLGHWRYSTKAAERLTDNVKKRTEVERKDDVH